MLFDVQAALADILTSPPCDIRDICDKPAPVSQLSQVSQKSASEKPDMRPVPPSVDCVAVVASVAAPPTSKQESVPSAGPDDDCYRHGRGVVGEPVTWTGRVVSLDEWRKLSEWEKHGSTGKLFSPMTGQWEPADGGAA